MLRGAIVGFGQVARFGHWPAYAALPDARIVAVVDRTPSRRELAASLSPALATFATIADLADAEPIDFLDICTPPAFHSEAMLDAVERGWHVLCEKPLALDTSTLDAVRQQASARGVAVVPVDNWKYAPIVLAATALLQQGAIGALRRVEIEAVRLGSAAAAHGVSWRRDPAIGGGGIVMDHGWHALYLALHWFGARPNEVVSTVGRRGGGTVEDEASIVLEFPNGRATIFLTWNGTERRNRIRLTGDAGEILLDDDVLHVTGAAACSTVFAPGLSAGSHHPDWFQAMLPRALACFREPTRARPLFDEAAGCLSIISRVYASAHMPAMLPR
jgi:predicted dehydrogenase